MDGNQQDIKSSLAEIKERLLVKSTPSTLFTFLYIYNKAHYDCFINYMAGAKELLDWLAPAGCPLDLELDKYPDIKNPKIRIPILLSGYEQSEVAKLLLNHTSGYTKDELEKAIFLVTNTMIIMELDYAYY